MSSENITIVDPSPSEEMVDYLSSNAIRHTAEVQNVDAPDVLMLAVKPQMMDAVLPGLRSLAGPDTVAVSVAAGTRIDTISEALGGVAVIRSMPNTPSLVGRGITVGCPGDGVSKTQIDQMECIGRPTSRHCGYRVNQFFFFYPLNLSGCTQQLVHLIYLGFRNPIARASSRDATPDQ